MLSRKHVAQQLQSSQNSRHRQMLEQELAALDTHTHRGEHMVDVLTAP